ncbi:MAG: integration host factor subunit alpha [Deltaproteobacteria bacterium]|nr:integration host factor subunit alpha [Deltaproteobacteria bacterium]
MALTKADLVESLAERGYRRKEAVELVETMLEILKETLARGEDVLVSGFGKFCMKRKRTRRGRNPQSGENLVLPERRVVTFKYSSVLRDKINGNSD